jgi:hypothetical protein
MRMTQPKRIPMMMPTMHICIHTYMRIHKAHQNEDDPAEEDSDDDAYNATDSNCSGLRGTSNSSCTCVCVCMHVCACIHLLGRIGCLQCHLLQMLQVQWCFKQQLYVCVCVCVCMYTSTRSNRMPTVPFVYIYIYIYIYTHTHIPQAMYMYIYIYTHTSQQLMQVQWCFKQQLYVCVCVCMCAYKKTYIHTYIQTSKHAYIHTHKHAYEGKDSSRGPPAAPRCSTKMSRLLHAHMYAYVCICRDHTVADDLLGAQNVMRSLSKNVFQHSIYIHAYIPRKTKLSKPSRSTAVKHKTRMDQAVPRNSLCLSRFPPMAACASLSRASGSMSLPSAARRAAAYICAFMYA